MAGCYTTPLKPTVVERSDKRDGKLCNIYIWVLDLSIWHLSTLKGSGKDFPILEPSSGSPPHVTPAPWPSVKADLIQFLRFPSLGRLPGLVYTGAKTASLRSICLTTQDL